jgi:two-component system chemotaxis sensor kinase CheA
MSENAKYREMFVQEAREHVQSLNQSLLKLEKEPSAREHLDAAFRSAHTIKGMAATMGYHQIRQLCRGIEELFDRIRKGETTLTSNMASLLFKCFDALQMMIADENAKVDLDAFLNELQNTNSVQEQVKSESEQVEKDRGLGIKSATIRVKMEDLDTLVNLVGELLIAKMRLEQTIPDSASDEARQVLMSLGRLVSDLQYQTMKVRLVPIEQIFNRFPRMVRDLSTALGKEINFEMDGLGIELDRTVLDAIVDPVLHMLRNAVDHGIEAPSERESIGKPRKGMIKLSALRVGDRVAIQVVDDGRGIDLERIRSRALEKNIITEEYARVMSDDEILDLVGTPGLSSAKEVTDVSGRGVGLDVVFNEVEQFGGQVKIETKKSLGTKITAMIPLSLAIIGGLVVNVSGEKYVMPLSNIMTTVQVSKEEVKKVHGKEVIVLRENVIPLIRVSNALGLNGKDEEKVTVVVVEKGGKSYGLIVDSYERKLEIVTKRLENSYTSSFSDATILPDGRVALILDPSTLV